MQIDQVGLSVGIPGKARPDLLANGATVTLTDTTAGGTTQFQILYRPPTDTDSVASLAPTGDNHVWTFHATSGVEGPWRIRLQHILSNGTIVEEIRILGFSTSGSGAIPPAPNERANEKASELNKADADIIFSSERNWATTDYPSGNPYGWSNSITGGGGGAVSSVFGRTGAVLAVLGDYPASKVSNDSSVSGATVKDALNTLLSSGVTSVFGRTGVVSAVSGDYPASKITNDSSVTGATVKDALNTLLSTTTLQAAYNAGATIALSSNDIVVSKSAVELLRVGSAATLKAADKTTAGATGDAIQILGSKGGAAAPAGAPGDGGTITLLAGTLGSETAAPGGVIGATSAAHVVIQGGGGGNTSGVKAGSVFLHGGQLGTGSAGGTNVPGDVRIGIDANKTHTIRSGQAGGTPWEHQGPIWTPLVTLVDGATITVSSDKSCRHKVVIGGARTLDFQFSSSFSNSLVSPIGVSGTLIVQQDATGGRTLAFAAKIKTSGDVTLNSAANAITVFYWTIEDLTHIHLRKVEATAGGGDFVGPGSSVSGNIVSFNGTTGKLGQDSGVSAASVVVGPASVTTNRIATFNGTTGKLIQDGGSLITDLVPTTRTITSGTGLSGGGDLSANRTLTVTSAPAITSATTTVNTSAATAPTNGQVLTATSGTTATWQTPTVGTGDFVGPGSSVSGNIVSFNGTTGKLGQDSGVAAASVVVGPASVTTNRIATFNGTTGKLIQDGGSLITDLVPTTRTITSGTGLSGGGDLSANRTLTVTSAPAITSATTTVNTSAATAPVAGQVLTATSGTAATWQTPGAGAGDFVGPGSSVSGNLVSFNGTTGKLGQDSGVAAANVVQSSRSITTGTGLSGGGDFSANRTHTVVSTPALQTTGAVVDVSAAAPPTTGQVLRATSATTATWQNLAAGSTSLNTPPASPGTIDDEFDSTTLGAAWFYRDLLNGVNRTPSGTPDVSGAVVAAASTSIPRVSTSNRKSFLQIQLCDTAGTMQGAWVQPITIAANTTHVVYWARIGWPNSSAATPLFFLTAYKQFSSNVDAVNWVGVGYSGSNQTRAISNAGTPASVSGGTATDLISGSPAVPLGVQPWQYVAIEFGDSIGTSNQIQVWYFNDDGSYMQANAGGRFSNGNNIDFKYIGFRLVSGGVRPVTQSDFIRQAASLPFQL